MKNHLAKIMKEPIFLFLVLGLVMYWVYTFLVGFIDSSERQILVTETQVKMLNETFQKTWNRPPTESEKQAQIENLIKDEVFFREAVAMGLDKSDPAVKRRLRQIIELMMDDLAVVYPSEDQLARYLLEHPDKFQEDATISFQHVYFPIDRKQDAENHLDKLKNNLPLDETSISSLSLIPGIFRDEPQFSIQRQFGENFAQEVFKLDTASWQGPVESAYGWHLVFISEIIPGYIPDLEDIWDEVEREWSLELRNEKKEQQYQKMKSQYEVKFELAK
jgi:hypothetical protein